MTRDTWAITRKPGNDKRNDAATHITTRSLRYLDTLRPPTATDTPATRIAEESLKRVRAISAPETPPAGG